MKNQILVFGGLLQDYYISVDHYPDRGQDGMIESEQAFVGGCAINMAVTASNLIRKKEGFLIDDDMEHARNDKGHDHNDKKHVGNHKEDACAHVQGSMGDISVHVISGLGDDGTSDWIRAYMNEHELSLEYTDSQPGSTGKCLVFVEPNGERTFLTKKGAEENFSQELADKILADGCHVAGVTGYYLLNPDADRVIQVLKELKKEGCHILFDPSPLVGYIKPAILKDIVELADVMTPNESEVDEICQAIGIHVGDKNTEEGLDRKALTLGISHLTRNGKTIFLKNGEKGGHVYRPDGDFPYGIVKANVVDTTGAGDSFAGALLYAMCCDLPVEEMVHIAAESAARTVEVYGPHGFW